jgi:chromosomal replication initiator protein
MQLFFDFPAKPLYTFANFVICSGNSMALEFVKRVMAPDSGENLLYLHGATGSGKTHLLSAICSGLANCPAGSQLSIIPLEALTEENCRSVVEQAGVQTHLLLDNLHLLADSNLLRSAVWQLFNDFYESGRKIVATATLPPKELKSLDEHLQSRFMWGLVAKLDISDDESRRMILGKLAADRQVILPSEVSDYLLVHVRRDIPSLAAALEQLKQRSFAVQKKISLKLAREVLG